MTLTNILRKHRLAVISASNLSEYAKMSFCDKNTAETKKQSVDNLILSLVCACRLWKEDIVKEKETKTKNNQ